MAARLNLLLIAALSLLPGLASAEPVRGFTRCAADLQLSFPLAGRIAQTLVREGSQVRKGDVLMHLDRAAEELDVQRRKVQWQGMADLMIAQARAETSGKQLAAARSVFNENRGISLEELQNRELAVRTTQAELERVRTLKETERLDYLTALENLERRMMTEGQKSLLDVLRREIDITQTQEAWSDALTQVNRTSFVASQVNGGLLSRLGLE